MLSLEREIHRKSEEVKQTKAKVIWGDLIFLMHVAIYLSLYE
jgi:hypothetical protein